MRYSILNISPAQVAAVGGKDMKVARHSGVVFATLTESQAKQLASLGYKVQGEKVVKADTTLVVAPPTPVAAAPTYTPEQFVYITRLEELRGITDPPLYGEGFNIAILDTGIRESHEQVKGRVVCRRNYTTDPMRDGFDHGTGVAAIVVAFAPLCNILNLKVLGEDGVGTTEEVVLAIDDCIDLLDTDPGLAPHVINLSLGAPDEGNPDDPLRVVCREAISRGIWVGASAGNGGPANRTITVPACEKYVAAVGSARYLPGDATFIVSDFSSRGPTLEGLVKPDLILFGEDLIVASSRTDTAVAAKSGTSFSTPFVSGMGLLTLEGLHRQVTYQVDQVPGVLPPGALGWTLTIQEMIDTYFSEVCIKPEGIAAGKDYEYGYGLPFGPLITQAITVPVADISTLLTGVVAVGMIGIMAKVMK